MIQLRSLRRFVSVNAAKTPVAGLWTKYNNCLDKYPLLTKAITSGLLSFGADLVCQIAFSEEFKKKKYSEIKIDFVRMLKFTLIGTAYIAPSLHYWYGFLIRKIPGTTNSSTLKRLFFDQAFFAPTFLIGLFSSVLTLDGSPHEIPNKIQTDLLPTVLANYSVWVPAQFINFKLVPPHLQVLWANAIGFFWNIYLSYVSYGKGDGEKLE